MILDLNGFLRELNNRLGVDLRAYKSNLLMDKISQRMAEVKITTSAGYLEKLLVDPFEKD